MFLYCSGECCRLDLRKSEVVSPSHEGSVLVDMRTHFVLIVGLLIHSLFVSLERTVNLLHILSLIISAAPRWIGIDVLIKQLVQLGLVGSQTVGIQNGVVHIVLSLLELLNE